MVQDVYSKKGLFSLPINWSQKQRRRSFAVLICSSFFYGPPPKEEDTKPPLCLILNIFCAEYAANTISSVYINLIKCCRIKKLGGNVSTDIHCLSQFTFEIKE